MMQKVKEARKAGDFVMCNFYFTAVIEFYFYYFISLKNIVLGIFLGIL